MKFRNNIYILTAMTLLISFSSCNDMLDMEPESSVSPEKYLYDESQLDAYALKCYDYLPWDGTVGPCASDNGTDIQAGMSVSNNYLDGQRKVGESGGSWGFGEIYNINANQQLKTSSDS